MSWFYLALIPPLLFGITNYIDKIILSRFVPDGAFGGLFIISTIIGIPSIPIILLLTSADLTAIDLRSALYLISEGALIAFYLLPYYQALQEEEPSVIIPLFQLVPIFTLVLEYLFLGTSISLMQLGGMFLVITSGIFISSHPNSRYFPKLKPFLLMALSCLIIAISLVIFKGIAEKQNFWTATCYSHLGGTLIGLGFLIFNTKFRNEFLKLISSDSKKFISWNLLNELLNVLAVLVSRYCFTVLLAPVTLVATISGIQPLVVFIIGIALTFLAPKLHQEKLTSFELYKKIICLLFITIGAVLIALG